MRSSRFFSALTLSAMLLTGCGDETTNSDSPACPAVEGETHLANTSSDLGAPVMLHVIGTECVVAGPNTLAIEYYDADDHTMAAAYEPTHDGAHATPEYVVVAVRPTMPSMGHGTHEAPVLTPDSGQFEVNFQMAGEWKVEIDFYDATVTPVTDTVAFTVQVH